MSNSTITPVVSINTHKANIVSRAEVESARTCLSMLTWNLQVQQVIALCGLGVSPALLDPAKTVAEGSHAHNLGHKTISDLVSSAAEAFGLATDWENFSEKMRALVFQSQYSIAESDYKEINKLVENVQSLLGYLPQDAYEFHSAREKALSAEIEALRHEMLLAKEGHKEKLRELMVQINEEVSKAQAAKAECEAVRKDCDAKIKEADATALLKIQAHEEKHQAEILLFGKRLESEFETKAATLRVDLMGQVDAAQRDKEDAEKTLAALQYRIESGDLIDKDQLRQAEEVVHEAQLRVETLQARLDEQSAAMAKVELANSLLSETVADKDGQIVLLQGQIDALGVQLRDTIEDKSSSPAFAVLSERAEHWQTQYEMQLTQLENLRGKLSTTEMMHHDLKSKYKSLAAKHNEMKSKGRTFTTRLEAKLRRRTDQVTTLEMIRLNQRRSIIGLSIFSGFSLLMFLIGVVF